MYKPKTIKFPTRDQLLRAIKKAKKVYVIVGFLNCPIEINKEQLYNNIKGAAWIMNDDDVPVTISDHQDGVICLQQYLK